MGSDFYMNPPSPTRSRVNIRVEHPTDRPNFTKVMLPWIVIWFSYETPIAFMARWTDSVTGSNGPIVRQNDWSATTGRHLNAIDHGDKDSRVPGDEFEQMLEHATNKDWELLRVKAKEAWKAVP